MLSDWKIRLSLQCTLYKTAKGRASGEEKHRTTDCTSDKSCTKPQLQFRYARKPKQRPCILAAQYYIDQQVKREQAEFCKHMYCALAQPNIEPQDQKELIQHT